MPQPWWGYDISQPLLLIPFLVLLPCTFVFASFSTCLLALLLFCLPNQLSSLRVEMLNESLSNTCVQLRSYRAFKISISWRREGENFGEAIWASRRYFGVGCGLVKELGIEFNSDWVRHLVWDCNRHYLPGFIRPSPWAARELLSHLTVKETKWFIHC